MMTSNRLTDSQRANCTLLGQRPFAKGRGFGLGVSVVLETDKSDMMRRGKPGTVSWPGAYGAWWQADPKDRSVLIFLATSVAGMDQMSKGHGLGVWMAIGTFQSLVS
jgi:CubicO group peptidase (beta-lactamase class C family)